MGLHGTLTTLPCNDHSSDQHHVLDQLPWKSTHYSEEVPKKFSVTDAEDLVTMRRIVPQGRDLASNSEQWEAKDIAVVKGVTP